MQIRLSHHVVDRRSICFVLDTYFEHYKQQQLCKELIIESFRDLQSEDYFGLYLRQEHAYQEESLDIPLEEKGFNIAIKEKILEQLLT